MARLIFAVVPLLALAPAAAQQDDQFQKAGVCARCHVISVVEWGMSSHRRAGTDCTACHGTSQGHVVDERNNVKPERVPHGKAVSDLCLSCHKDSRSPANRNVGCDACHQVHALLNPNKPPAVRDEALEQRAVRWESFDRHMQAGDQAAQAQQWNQARAAFQAALLDIPGDPRAAQRLRVCERRLRGVPPGFEAVGPGYDGRTGLPTEVRVAGLGISMLLVPGGELQMGSDRFPGARPVHTLAIEPFYLAKCELTQAEWAALMGANPSEQKGNSLPAESVSWEDAQALLRKLNEKVPGAGFRLPTEAEWEFAARAASLRDESLASFAWFDDAGGPAAPHPVARKKPGATGFFDLQGNVWEWTSSLAMPYPYDPSDGREDPAAQGLRILRGGGYADSASLLDPAMRHAERPDRRLRWNGIRLARGVPEEPPAAPRPAGSW
jgi:formylglycine-generating enzyme required for sulfatase activity